MDSFEKQKQKQEKRGKGTGVGRGGVGARHEDDGDAAVLRVDAGVALQTAVLGRVGALVRPAAGRQTLHRCRRRWRRPLRQTAKTKLSSGSKKVITDSTELIRVHGGFPETV